MKAIDLSKQQALGADPKAVQLINFTGNLAWEGNTNTTMVTIWLQKLSSIKKNNQENF